MNAATQRIMTEKFEDLDEGTQAVLQSIVEHKEMTRKDLADLMGHGLADKATIELLKRGLIKLDLSTYTYSPTPHLAAAIAEHMPPE